MQITLIHFPPIFRKWYYIFFPFLCLCFTGVYVYGAPAGGWGKVAGTCDFTPTCEGTHSTHLWGLASHLPLDPAHSQSQLSYVLMAASWQKPAECLRGRQVSVLSKLDSFFCLESSHHVG